MISRQSKAQGKKRSCPGFFQSICDTQGETKERLHEEGSGGRQSDSWKYSDKEEGL